MATFKRWWKSRHHQIWREILNSLFFLKNKKVFRKFSSKETKKPREISVLTLQQGSNSLPLFSPGPLLRSHLFPTAGRLHPQDTAFFTALPFLPQLHRDSAHYTSVSMLPSRQTASPIPLIKTIRRLPRCPWNTVSYLTAASCELPQPLLPSLFLTLFPYSRSLIS